MDLMPNYSSRPRVKPETGFIDRLLIIATPLLVILYIAYIFKVSGELPDRIPVHYNFKGEPDRWGGKGSIWFLPILETVLYVAMEAITRIPHLFNYPVKITEKNARQQYTLGVRLIRFINLGIVILFFTISLETTRAAVTGTEAGGITIIVLVLALTFIPIAAYLILANRYK